MNIQSLGPNVNLAPLADPADGELDVILVPASQRGELAGYIEHRLKYGRMSLSYTRLIAQRRSK